MVSPCITARNFCLRFLASGRNVMVMNNQTKAMIANTSNTFQYHIASDSNSLIVSSPTNFTLRETKIMATSHAAIFT